jgi:heme-degrading monooxygenase HmoA
MPVSSWQNFQRAEPQREYLVQLSYLPLLRYRSFPRFARLLFAIQRELRGTDGIIGYSLLAHPLQRDFWTLSAWQNKNSLNTFVRSQVHATAMKTLHAHMGQTRFIEWTVSGSSLPPSWSDALTRFYRQASNGSL